MSGLIRFAKGDRVRITAGDFAGKVGHVEETPVNGKSQWRVVSLVGVRRWYLLETKDMELFPEESKVVKL